MLTAYIQAAMRHATYEILEGDEGFYGEIPGLQGVLGNADTLERIAAALARIERAEADAARAAALVERLEQETLARAFRGEL